VPTGYFVIGGNHRNWTGSVRDRLFTEPGEVPAVLEGLKAAGLSQALWLATCDRVEVVAAHPRPADAALAVAGLMARRAGLDFGELAGQLLTLTGLEAVRHVFAVASSLESQVVGEPQVLGQVKAAYRLAVAAKLAGPELDALMRAAFAVAKRVRTETVISERPTSIAAAAVDIARDLHGDLGKRRGLLIGLGDMGIMMAEQLRQAGLGALTVADIVVTAVGLGRYILTSGAVTAALRLRRRRPVFIIDAALPTDVEPAVGDIDAAFVYDLSDLERVALQGRVSREAAAAAAWELVEQAVAGFVQDRAARAATPIVAALRRHFDGERRRVLVDAGGLGAEEATRRLVNRLLHQPCEQLRQLAAESGGCGLAERAAAERLLRTLFRLDDEAETTANEDEAP